MVETVGAVILAAAGLGDVVGIAGFGTLAGTTIAGVSLATVVGSAVVLGATIGLQYALTSSRAGGLPTPESGSQAVKQSIPPRIRGYGRNRLAGYVMLFEATGAAPATSYDLLAFHSGRISQIIGFYLHDDPVRTSPNISFGGVAEVQGDYSDGRYSASHIFLETALGGTLQAASTILTGDSAINGVWTPAFQGNGIAWVAMKCFGSASVPGFTQIYPHQLPVLSVVAYCSVVCDPRDPAQFRNDESTWQVSFNPVVQLMDYLTRDDGGMGLDYDTVIAPNLAAWIVEANLCDELVATADGGTEPRYASHGWFLFDNKPEDVIGGILSTCDGWLAETGDGTLSIVTGVYRTPTDPPLTENHILGFALNYGQADEQSVNQLEVSFTDPDSKYVSVQTEPWRDEESISLTGTVRSQALDLKWVQSNSQARRLASRAMQRLNPQMTGSFTTTLYGLRYLGKRWVPVQYPFVSGLQDCVVEIQGAEVDLMAGRINWTFNRVSTSAIEAYDPTADEGVSPVSPPSSLAPRLDFSKSISSQYLALFEDI